MGDSVENGSTEPFTAHFLQVVYHLLSLVFVLAQQNGNMIG
jgi:hypothetical protein